MIIVLFILLFSIVCLCATIESYGELVKLANGNEMVPLCNTTDGVRMKCVVGFKTNLFSFLSFFSDGGSHLCRWRRIGKSHIQCYWQYLQRHSTFFWTNEIFNVQKKRKNRRANLNMKEIAFWVIYNVCKSLVIFGKIMFLFFLKKKPFSNLSFTYNFSYWFLIPPFSANKCPMPFWQIDIDRFSFSSLDLTNCSYDDSQEVCSTLFFLKINNLFSKILFFSLFLQFLLGQKHPLIPLMLNLRGNNVIQFLLGFFQFFGQFKKVTIHGTNASISNCVFDKFVPKDDDDKPKSNW